MPEQIKPFFKIRVEVFLFSVKDLNLISKLACQYDMTFLPFL